MQPIVLFRVVLVNANGSHVVRDGLPNYTEALSFAKSNKTRYEGDLSIQSYGMMPCGVMNTDILAKQALEAAMSITGADGKDQHTQEIAFEIACVVMAEQFASIREANNRADREANCNRPKIVSVR